jgi:hypothetical protein
MPHDWTNVWGMAAAERTVAHMATGFVPVADARTMRQRVRDDTWAFEMLCDGGICVYNALIKGRRY